MKIEFDVDDILAAASNSEKEELYNELKEDYSEDVEDLVDNARSSEKRRIFDSLWESGYGDDYVNENQKVTIEDKRFMMDKKDESMLTYLIEKYKYFT